MACEREKKRARNTKAMIYQQDIRDAIENCKTDFTRQVRVTISQQKNMIMYFVLLRPSRHISQLLASDWLENI